MKTPVSILSAALAAAIFSSCESSNPYNQTVFNLENGPRPGSGEGRYGYQGDGSETNERRNRRSASRTRPETATTSRGETRVLRREKPKEEKKKKPADEALDEVANDFASSSNEVAEVTSAAEEKPDVPSEPVEKKKVAGAETLKPTTSTSDKPFADPVAGKYGHVISPFSPGKEIDVTGFPPGTEVRCPYTQKIFRVP